ncbi:MAG: hypothetical protein J6P89_00120 [Oscillospiraceae bacterium]|nr:hypothetical protein [Oscillospiraceae bacterium]
MNLNEDKENTQSENKTDNKKWKAWEKNLLAGAICFTLGLTAPIAVAMNVKSHTNKSHQETVAKLKEENRSLKKQLEEQKEKIVEKIVTVPVYVTESIQTTKETAPVTDVVATETVKARKETAPVTDVPETETKAEAETKKQISEDDVRALTNPLTKKAAAPYQYTRAADWKDYWIEVKRSDLFGMKPDDFKFFNDYINEKFSIEGSFFVFVTDVPDLCFSFEVTKSDYIRNMGEAFVGIDQKTYNPYHPYLDIGSCAVRFNDANQFEIQGLYKDEYGLEQFDDDKIYYFSEFNDDMFAKLDELQEYAKKLWG